MKPNATLFGACLTIATALAPIVAPAADAEPARHCTPVHVIEAPGTGGSHSWDTSAGRPLFDDDSSPARDLIARLGEGTVSSSRLAYPATTMRLNGLIGSNATGGADANDGTEPLTYGESHAIGRDRASEHLREVAAACPGTRFILVGFSQGAHILGDVASLAAHGEIDGVSADDIAAVTLFADPARSPLFPAGQVPPSTPADTPPRPSRLYAPAPAGVTALNGETVNSGGGVLDPATVGMTGPRAGTFAGLEGKVLSLCNPLDMACASSEGSLVRTLSDVAARVEDPSPGTGPTVVTPQLVQAAFAELNLMARTGYEVNGAGLNPAQMGALILVNALPLLLRETASDEVLADLIGPELAPSVLAAVARPFPTERARQDALYAATKKALEEFARAAGLGPVMDDPRFVELARTARMAGDFGPQHFAYYKDGYTQNYRIDGKSGYAYALDWMEQAARAASGGH